MAASMTSERRLANISYTQKVFMRSWRRDARPGGTVVAVYGSFDSILLVIL